jgi:hypothetical protein
MQTMQGRFLPALPSCIAFVSSLWIVNQRGMLSRRRLAARFVFDSRAIIRASHRIWITD